MIRFIILIASFFISSAYAEEQKCYDINKQEIVCEDVMDNPQFVLDLNGNGDDANDDTSEK